jgi:acyl-CoA synthetase (AMP-forming)/AMP-acid ligase II
MFYCDWLYRRELLSPNKAALIDAINSIQSITYRRWDQRINRVAHYKVPTSVIFLKELPKTGAAKVDKNFW